MGSIGSVSTTFKSGDTPSAISNDVQYKVEKMNSRTNETYDAGVLYGSDIKPMLKGYTFNGLFWDKDKSSIIYTVTRR